MSLDPYVAPSARLPDEPPSALSLWLSLPLLPVLALLLLIVHHAVQSIAIHVGVMPDSRNLELAGLVLGSILGPAVTAMLFAYPIARLYAQRSALAAILVCAPTIASRIHHYAAVTRLPWTNAISYVQWVSLFLLVPLAAWLLHRRRVRRALKGPG
jgi:hypothetical protein